MAKYAYPAVFHRAEEGGVWVSFPDLPECLTEGDDMGQAYSMAVEALGLCLIDMEKEREVFPQPSEPEKVSVGEEEYFVVVEFNLLEYKKA